jgi:hypothetical protein
MSTLRSKVLLAGAIAALGAGSLGSVGIAQAKHGADDPAGHDVRDDHGGRRVRVHAHVARHGRDDRVSDDRRGNGTDDRAGDDRGGH